MLVKKDNEIKKLKNVHNFKDEKGQDNFERGDSDSSDEGERKEGHKSMD